MLWVKNRVQRCADSSFSCDHLTQELLRSCLIIATYKEKVDKLKLVELENQF